MMRISYLLKWLGYGYFYYTIWVYRLWKNLYLQRFSHLDIPINYHYVIINYMIIKYQYVTGITISIPME